MKSDKVNFAACREDSFTGLFGGGFLGFCVSVAQCAQHIPPRTTTDDFIANVVFGTLAGGGFGFFYRYMKEQARLEDVERSEQERLRAELERNATAALQLFEAMPAYLLTAEELLDQAERDFSEGAFSPFWASVEGATRKLGAFDGSVRSISANYSRYQSAAAQYKSAASRFPLSTTSVDGMAAANSVTVRLNAIVRKAHRNYQFATIYEQRKTNQILVAGFQTLAEALDGMASRIEYSMDSLRVAVSDLSSVVEKGMGDLQATTRDVKDRHDQALLMLDNIQRHRKPTG